MNTSSLASVYQMAVNNCALTVARNNLAKKRLMSLSSRATKKRRELESQIIEITAFELSTSLAIAFAKRKEDVLADIINASESARETVLDEID
ncbi:hypothetical protein [Vibrio owensii]|uniref:hypothetical protein n=1 Tax=Vibrio harveyi group TaxID=717610 RepID=UPI003CC6CB67